MKEAVLEFTAKVNEVIEKAQKESMTWEEAWFEIKAQYIINLEDINL